MMVGVDRHVLVLDLSTGVLHVGQQGGQGRYEQGVQGVSESKK